MSTQTVDVNLAHARYGKDKVRVFRIVREGKWHHVVEYNVCALVEGDIEMARQVFQRGYKDLKDRSLKEEVRYISITPNF